MAAENSFEIYIRGVPGDREDERRRADQAPQSELPPLSGEEKKVAKKLFDLTEEQYQRSKLALDYAGQRSKERAAMLGRRVQEILGELGPGYRLVAVAGGDRWALKIQAEHDRTASITVPFELVDDVLDFGASQDVDRLKNLVLFGVGRQELILKH